MSESSCVHSVWRWLDCSDCERIGIDCDIKVCVDCGEDL